jgi:UDP-glucose 4-epimerase
MKNILVTGGAGFIGSHTVVELVEAGYHPVIIDNFSNSEPPVIESLEKLLKQPVTFYEQDYQDIEKLQKVVEKENITGIIHFAAYKAVNESVNEPLKYYENNVGGLIKLLQYSETAPLENFVFSSSCTVYGEPDKVPVTEDSPVKPAESPYGTTKKMCEDILSDATKVTRKYNSISLRYFNPIGAHPSAMIGELPKGIPANLVPFVAQAAAGLRDKLVVFGNDYDTPDGSCIRDYIHVADLAKAHVKALDYLEKQPASHYETVNVGTGKGTSVLELLKTFENVNGVKVPYEIGPRRDGDIVATYASVDKAHELLGWRAEKSLADALADAWRWQQTLSA